MVYPVVDIPWSGSHEYFIVLYLRDAAPKYIYCLVFPCDDGVHLSESVYLLGFYLFPYEYK